MLQLRSLRHLVMLARRLNFARAAEELGISQSALSRSIQALEAQLGMRLFDRDRAGVSLTPQGEQMVERAGTLLADADDFEHHARLNALGAAGRIRFGIGPMPARALLPLVRADRLRDAPDMTNDVVVRDVDGLWALLLAGDVEFFVSQEGLLADATQARIETLGHFPLSLIVRAGHPLLAGDCPGATFPMVRSSWVGLPLPPEIRSRVRGAAHIIEDFGSLAAVTAATDAIWFSSTYAVTGELAAGRLCELPRPAEVTPLEVRIGMYTLARRSPSPAARAFRQAFRLHIRDLGQGMG
jgi:DNA-binding transcriptional LysR family regulator